MISDSIDSTAALALPAFDWSSLHNNTLSVLIVRRTSGHRYADRLRARLLLAQGRGVVPQRLFENVIDTRQPSTLDLQHLKQFVEQEVVGGGGDGGGIAAKTPAGRYVEGGSALGQPSLVVCNVSLLTRDDVQRCTTIDRLLQDGHYRRCTFVLEDVSLDKISDAQLRRFDLIFLCCPSSAVRYALYDRLGGPGTNYAQFCALLERHVPPHNADALVIDQRANEQCTARRFFLAQVLPRCDIEWQQGSVVGNNNEASSAMTMPVTLQGALSLLAEQQTTGQYNMGQCLLL